VIRDLADLGDAPIGPCDVLIVGGGPAGLTVARGLAAAGRSTLVLESGGLQEQECTESLNETLSEAGLWTPHQADRRQRFHAHQTRMWAHGRQGFGVRCRALGGSTVAWAGKSAAFTELDYTARPWVPDSGWPVTAADLAPHVDRAAEALNLGLNCYDGRLWEHLRRAPPAHRPDPAVLDSFFWQFARSTLDPTDVLHAGTEFLHAAPKGCRVLTGATVLEVLTDASGARACAVRVADATGARRTIEARTIVLAASAIENARLLLNSRAHHPQGLGNQHDMVGRCLMDHPNARIARFSPQAIPAVSRLYGFYGLRGPRGVSMYMHGLAPTARVQADEGLLNCAAYTMGERAPDDPWSAVRRIAKRQSRNVLSDAQAILKSPGIMAKGLARLAFQSQRVPKAWTHFAVQQVLRWRPGLAVEEYLTRGVPHKLVGLSLDAVCEQAPDRNNRIELSPKTDRFGMPLPVARWRIGEREMHTLTRLATLVQQEFARAGLPPPVVADWIADRDAHSPDIIDMGHTAGTTRMAADPGRGVVDADCKVHGVDGLYVAGASIFPTSGHANPTLMIVAFAHRLAEHLARRSRP